MSGSKEQKAAADYLTNLGSPEASKMEIAENIHEAS